MKAFVQGYRADIFMEETSRTIAAYYGHKEVTEEDVKEASELVLLHRIKKPSQSQKQEKKSDKNDDHRKNKENRDLKKNEDNNKKTSPNNKRNKTVSKNRTVPSPRYRMKFQGIAIAIATKRTLA